MLLELIFTVILRKVTVTQTDTRTHKILSSRANVRAKNHIPPGTNITNEARNNWTLHLHQKRASMFWNERTIQVHLLACSSLSWTWSSMSSVWAAQNNFAVLVHHKNHKNSLEKLFDHLPQFLRFLSKYVKNMGLTANSNFYFKMKALIFGLYETWDIPP